MSILSHLIFFNVANVDFALTKMVLLELLTFSSYPIFFFANQDVDYIKTVANIVHPSFAKTTLRKAQITTRSLHIVFHLQTEVRPPPRIPSVAQELETTDQTEANREVDTQR